MSQHVAVLLGGWSSEREVSLVTGQAVCAALEAVGYRVTPIDVGPDVFDILTELEPDVAFNALHGRFGEDGCIQGMLEVLKIPYTHSGVLASALAMDKPRARQMFASVCIPCPEGQVVHRDEVLEGKVFEPPYVLKPTNEGSSVGVHLVFEGDNMSLLDESNWTYGEYVLMERYIPGREIQVAVMDDKALGAIEVRPKKRFYDYEAKYSDGWADHVMPADIPEADYQESLRLALLAHQTLGCRGVTRSDLRYDDTLNGDAHLYMLEVNTQPGMTPLSLVPEIAAHVGISFAELTDLLVQDAGCQR
jgi:D-alanine-D-alanine ligase